jgi:signal transduction histidine kinase
MTAMTGTVTTETVDNRIIAVMRLVLAASALLIIFIDPTQPNHFVTITYLTLVLYTLYSAVLYTLALRNSPILKSIYAWAHWADVAWYILLIGLSSGTSSIFFFGFFFAILVASFRWGFASGLRVTIVSVLLSTVVGLATAPPGPDFELARSMIRPTYLLVLGYMMAYWGGFEIALKRRLALLREVMALSNPRFGVDRTIGLLIERLRTFYDVDTALLVTIHPATGEHRLFRTDRDRFGGSARVELITPQMANLLLSLPAELALVYGSRPSIGQWWRSASSYYAFNVTTGEQTEDGQAASDVLAGTLDAQSFVSIPVRYRGEFAGRLYLIAKQRCAFEESDINFLLQVLEQVTPVIENIRLVDRLALDAAEEERKKIARDLHDSMIQPYIGLQIGIAAVRKKLAAGNTDITGDIEHLMVLSSDGVADLRRYVHGVRDGSAREGGLLPALHRFASRFSDATCIDVQIRAAEDIHINDRLAAEVFQMVAEGLSNIRRHTQSRRATVQLARQNNCLTLRIENESNNGSAPVSFTPRSLTERAAALGGHARVEQSDGTSTAVIIEIPL